LRRCVWNASSHLSGILFFYTVNNFLGWILATFEMLYYVSAT